LLTKELKSPQCRDQKTTGPNALRIFLSTRPSGLKNMTPLRRLDLRIEIEPILKKSCPQEKDNFVFCTIRTLCFSPENVKIEGMKILFGFLLIVLAGAIVAYEHFDISYWQTPPAVRASNQWKIEVEKVTNKSKQLKTALQLIKKIEQKTTDQQFKDMIDATTSPFRTVNNGTYDLKLQFMPWIEDMKYGYLIQHELFDSKGNKVSEFNVNVDIGRLW
jgi:hypothetical protein